MTTTGRLGRRLLRSAAGLESRPRSIEERRNRNSTGFHPSSHDRAGVPLRGTAGPRRSDATVGSRQQARPSGRHSKLTPKTVARRDDPQR
jgi:hypothetical protein